MHYHWNNIIRPHKLLIDYISLSHSYGKFIIEPLEKSFGITIGNALRRILLTSLYGYAITSIFIENVSHEFISLPGIKEDINDLILNLKSVQLMLIKGTNFISAKIIKKGPCIIRAKNIIGKYLKIFNQNLYICTLSSNIELNVCLTIEKGKGYMTANYNRLNIKKKNKHGIIWFNSNFNPIKKISFNILNTKIGNKSNYDKLIIEIWTNNSIHPEDALGIAAKILKEQLSIFIKFPEINIKKKNKIQETIKPVLNKNLFSKISELELSVRSSNCLHSAKIKTIGDLVQKTEIEMLRTKNFGRKSLKEIKDILFAMNLSLNMKLKNWNKIKLFKK